ncbi:unnamed protein product [Heterobilharzia americana]|nr:unnamed protein product [Heterobilharzia americana]
MDSSIYSSQSFLFRNRITPPGLLAKMTNKTTEFIHNLRNCLESPTLKISRNLLSQRRFELADKFSTDSSRNINNNNTESNEVYSSSLRTTSTSSSMRSGCLGFKLSTTVDVDDPLPIPVCRLGKYQAEWNTGELGAWRLLTHDASLSLPENHSANQNESSLSVLKYMNTDLKKEQEFLLAKLNLLYDSLIKQTAVVNQHEKKLEQLRAELKQKTENTPENLRADHLHELNKQTEHNRPHQLLDLILLTESMSSENTEIEMDTINSVKCSSSSISPVAGSTNNRKTNGNQIFSIVTKSTNSFDQTHSSNLLNQTTKHKESEDIDESNEEDGEKSKRSQQKLRINMNKYVLNNIQNLIIRPDDVHSIISTGKSKSPIMKSIDSELTSHDSSYTEISTSHTDESVTDTTLSTHQKSSQSSDNDEDDDKDIRPGCEILQESSSQEKNSKTDDDDSEEELTKTDESESRACVTQRQRVVQFGTISRR